MRNEIQNLKTVIERNFAGRPAVQVLEAGCGAANYAGFLPNAHVTGIDISKKQLERNDRLAEKIVGDIQRYSLPPSHFDAIFCWNVLEHLSDPGRALKNFIHGLKENGLIVLAIPNPLSFKGLVTKLTPHWFHVWVYKTVKGIKDAGKEDTGPFRTFLRFSLAPGALLRFAREHGLSIELFNAYESPIQVRAREKFGAIEKTLKFVQRVTLDKIATYASDFVIVLKKEVANVIPA